MIKENGDSNFKYLPYETDQTINSGYLLVQNL